MKNYKICVHIPLYLEKTKKRQLNNFKKVCNSFLKISKRTKLFIHSNKKLKSHNRRIKYIFHSFKNSHPFKLTWLCRNLMESQKDDYDIFIYCEDDLLFTKKNFKYWIGNKDKCIQNNYNLGFLRVELNKRNKKFYSTDQVEESKYYVDLLKKKYLVLANSNSSFWIYDKNEFSKFIKTKYWKFDWKWISISDILLIREMAAVGWHGQNMNGIDMGRYLATIVPLKNGKVENKSFIRHLSDNYANAPRGLFGTFSMNDIVKKDLKKFIPTSFLGRFFKRLKYMAYHLLRINIKKHFRTSKLHNDLKSGLIFR
tara:strand:- start:653 stop:1588 length:936 start_codon:yes stop_codon:yes gene_type:complete